MNSDNDYYSEYYSDCFSGEEIDNYGEISSSNRLQKMLQIDNEVYEVYRYLQKEVDSNSDLLLENLSLKLVYDLMYPNYQSLF
jgi:hypothetical protein